MVLLDGGSCESPGFLTIPYPHKSDKQYWIDNEKNYYPDATEEMEDADIGGGLHEEL